MFAEVPSQGEEEKQNLPADVSKLSAWE